MTMNRNLAPQIRQLKLLVLGAALATILSMVWSAQAKAGPEDFGFESTSATLSTTQAGGHPDFVSDFTLAGDPSKPGSVGEAQPWDYLRNVDVELPPGLTGNPEAYPKCDANVFVGSAAIFGVDPNAPQCPVNTQVGTVLAGYWSYIPYGFVYEPLYNLASPGGDVVARLGFYGAFYPILIDIRVDPERDNALTVSVANAPSALMPYRVTTTVWGVPSDPSHDSVRFSNVLDPVNCGVSCTPNPSTMQPTAFMTNPTSCGPKHVRMSAESYMGFFATPSIATLGSITGCDELEFDPAIDLDPTTNRADSSSGMDVSIGFDQSDITDPDKEAPAHLKRAVVTLPEGMSLNPAAADGLGSCSEAQIGLTSTSPIRFNDADPTCPDASKVGTVKITTPVLADPLEGDLYLAEQDDNPFDSLLAGYMVAKGKGVIIKLAGNFELDPDTGRITATFDNNPQQPFSDLELHFKGGSRGVLVTPPTCGEYDITTKMVPWSAADPDNPTPNEVVSQTSTFTVDSAPDGGPCLAGDPSQPGDPADRAQLPNSPSLDAGTVVPLAGQHSPFVLRLQRPDGTQELTRIDADLPPGMVGKLAGIPQCSDAALASIDNSQGTGQDELDSPSCPAGSQLGYANVGAGAGSTPVYVPGKVYLAGPYKGAPLSLAVVTPVVTGPFDLGTVVIRSALHVDQDDAQIHVRSDRIPTILEGIPLHVRDIRVVLNRDGFTLNPTNCNPMQTTGAVGGAGGLLNDPADDTSAAVSDAFQVQGCGGLDFRPSLSAAILNGTQGIHRSDHPNLQFNLHPRPGDANLASVGVLLPPAFQIDQANLGNICSETELAQSECAGRNTVGSAQATTPLLDTPLTGPVYAVSGSGGLPKLAVILHGPPEMPIKLVVRGITETVGARIKNTFPLVPDTPVSDFTLTLNGGPGGYLVNNTNVCGKAKKAKKRNGKKARKRLVRTPLTADASYAAQNGDTFAQRLPIAAQCPKLKNRHTHKKP
jgi:hypothetical protein